MSGNSRKQSRELRLAAKTKGTGEAMESIGKSLTSPAKLAFAGFVILAYRGALCDVTLWKFAVVAVLFIALQALHDDFLRIILNRYAHSFAARRGWPKD
jgi:hypothetical protein